MQRSGHAAGRRASRKRPSPMAMILAGAALFQYIGTTQATQISRAIYEAVFEAVYDGARTADLSGTNSTTEVTNETIRRVKSTLEVWAALGQ